MPPKRKAKSSGNATPAKRPTARKDLLHDEKHVFSAKSKLVKEDLTAFFANPATWNALSEEEKDTIRGLMPADMIYTDDGAPSQAFLRYDNDWRNSVRLFGEDVQAGRYEPEWLEEAHEASRLRRSGAFDEWKEQQFEEFWGQKSEAHADLMAGKAINIRLPEMIAAGLFRVGDVFAYTRSLGAGKNGFIVEKNPIVSKISGKTMTFTMASGSQRDPSSQPSQSPIPAKPAQDKSLTQATPSFVGHLATNGATLSPITDHPEPVPEIKPDPVLSAEAAASPTRSPSNQSSPAMQPSASSSQPSPIGAATSEDGIQTNPKQLITLSSALNNDELVSAERITNASPNTRKRLAQTISVVVPTSPTKAEKDCDDSDSPLSSIDDEDPDFGGIDMSDDDDDIAGTPDNSVVHDTVHVSRSNTPQTTVITTKAIDSLHTLEQKILQVDGRYKGEPRANAWRTFRCKRGKKDLGTLADMREAYYKQKHG